MNLVEDDQRSLALRFWKRNKSESAVPLGWIFFDWLWRSSDAPHRTPIRGPVPLPGFNARGIFQFSRRPEPTL